MTCLFGKGLSSKCLVCARVGGSANVHHSPSLPVLQEGGACQDNLEKPLPQTQSRLDLKAVPNDWSDSVPHALQAVKFVSELCLCYGIGDGALWSRILDKLLHFAMVCMCDVWFLITHTIDFIHISSWPTFAMSWKHWPPNHPKTWQWVDKVCYNSSYNYNISHRSQDYPKSGGKHSQHHSKLVRSLAGLWGSSCPMQNFLPSTIIEWLIFSSSLSVCSIEWISEGGVRPVTGYGARVRTSSWEGNGHADFVLL